MMPPVIDEPTHPEPYGDRQSPTLDWLQWRARIDGQLALVIQHQLAQQGHLLTIERLVAQREMRMVSLGLVSGILGGLVSGLLWLLFHVVTKIP